MTMLKTRLERLEKLKNEKTAFKDIFDLFEKIFLEREKVKKEIAVFKDYPDEDGIGVRLKEGFPVADQKSFVPDMALFEKYVMVLLDIMAAKNADAVQYLKCRLQQSGESFDAFFEKISSEGAPSYIDSFEKGKDVLVFVINEALKPFFEKYCEGIRDRVTQKRWTGGTCPVCGSYPSISELRGEEGKRYLVCADCSMEWSYDRIRCPFCETEQQQDLEYFTPENDSRYRVMLCKRCKHYLKVIDFREMEKSPVFEVEHLGTLHLDAIARKDGYETEDALVNLIL